MKIAKTGVIKKKTVSRKVSRVTKKIQKLKK
jgi:ribosomal protein S20